MDIRDNFKIIKFSVTFRTSAILNRIRRFSIIILIITRI